MSYQRVNPTEFKADKNACVLDVRTNAEVETERLRDSLHIPLHELTPEKLKSAIASSGKSPNKIYLLCQGGKRAEMAAEQLQGHMDAELYVIEGGLTAIKAAAIPLQKGSRNTISIERQVRIGAGSLVLLGLALGTLVNSNFYFLSGLVGAGLVFAGITDICMMGMLLTRMPWNK